MLNYASAGGGYGEADFFFRPGGVAVRQIRFFTRIGAEVESTFESNEDMRGALSFVMTMVNYYDPDKLFRNCYWQLARDEDGIWRMGRIEYEPGTEDADGGREEEGLLRKLLDAGDYEIRADEAGYTEWIARSRELTPDPVSGSITVDGVTLRAGMTYADVLACGLEAYYPEYPLTSSRETESEYIRVAEMKLPCGEKIKVWLSLPAGGEHDSSDQSMIENGVLSGVQMVGVAGFGFDYRGFTSASSIGDVLDAFGGSPYAALESADEIVIQFAAGGASDDVEYEDIIFTFTPDGSAVTDVAFYVQRRYENAAD